MPWLQFIFGILLLYATAQVAWGYIAISGTVHDVSGHALAFAEVQIQSESTGTLWKVQSDDKGYYSVAGLPAGLYKLTARVPGFRTVARTGVAVEPFNGARIDFLMDLLTLHQTITVVSGRDQLDPSTGETLTLARESPGAKLPTNGPDFRSSFDLMPGIVVTPAAVGDAGQFTSNGQRPNASSYWVDGARANTGVGGSALPGSFPGASLPAMTAIGSAENLASPSVTQLIELRTASFAPEFGDRPGASALIVTRAGSNDFHGEFFSNVRDNGWTARDWFANSRGIPFPRQYYRSLGGVVGGPVIRNRTFVFISSETSQLNFGGLRLGSVPSLAAREEAPLELRQILNSFPLPTGPDLGDGVAEGLMALSRTASVSSYSARLDQSLGSYGNVFARLVHAPSSLQSAYFDGNNGRLSWSSATIGLTAGRDRSAIHDVRLNYSRARLWTTLDAWPGLFDIAGLLSLISSHPLSGLSGPWNGAATVLGLSVPGFGQFIGGGLRNPRQDQRQLRYTVAKQVERHQFRAGIDYTRLEARRDGFGASMLATAPSVRSLVDGGPLAVTYSAMPQSSGSIHTASLFAQDTIRMSDRLNFIYGVRWELTPPTLRETEFPSVSGLWNGADWQVTHSGNVNVAAPWPMRYSQVAPRIGAAYRLPMLRLVLRAGAGVFYDATLGAAINPIHGAPFNSWQFATGTTGSGHFAASDTQVPSPADTSDDVRRFLTGAPPALRLPTSYQWRVSLERGVGERGVASVAYIGAVGRNLLGNEAYLEPQSGILTRFITQTRRSSNYQALQLRYAGSLGASVYCSAAYTWSHSIDEGSQDSSVFLIHPGYKLSDARASSSFDVRQALTTTLSYQVPHSLRLTNALSAWTISAILRARTGFPIDVKKIEQGLGGGFDNVGRPSVVQGEPIWISDSSVAGGRRLNRAAFSLGPTSTQSTLGRNAISGNGLAQLDVSLRREFPLIRGTSLELGLNVFNVLNHPAFADPVPFLLSPFFGQSVSMQNLMLGSGAPNTGLPPLFHTGGARTAEFRIRFSF